MVVASRPATARGGGPQRGAAMKATVIVLALLLGLAAGGVGTMIAFALLIGLAASSAGAGPRAGLGR